MSSDYPVLTLITNNMWELIAFLPEAELYPHILIDNGAIIYEDD
jgi:hypothetical protein